MNEIKEICQKYCGLCASMNLPSKYRGRNLFVYKDEYKKYEDKEQWYKAAMPSCNVNEIKQSCQKYHGLCKGM